MKFFTRKYPFQDNQWMLEGVRDCVIVFLILYLLQPFGFSFYSGNKFVASLLFAGVTFLCVVVYHFLLLLPLQRRVRVWRIWHEVLAILGMVLLIGLCNLLLASALMHFKIGWKIGLMFLYWTLIIGVIISAISVALSYQRLLRGQLDSLLDKTTEAQAGITVTLHDTRVRGNDLSLPINDLLYIEAQKNNVAVCYLRDGELERSELQSTLAAVLADLADYDNIFQCHRSFAVNVNNVSAARGNSNGYTLELGEGVAAVPVSRSYVPKLKSFIG
ncbi:MAG: LytTR family transcriptional regulator [Bacteroidales bacterium]|nr:LytTR family transcriptional regulator [Bacteroidales bacterium]